MQIQKLNRNYNGYGFFTHRIQFIGLGVSTVSDRCQRYISLRNWLWNRFGPSAEQALARPQYFGGEQPKWAWDAEKSAIYLRDEALTEFILMQDRYR